MSDWYWVLILVYFVVSAIGGAASRKMKKAQERARREQAGEPRPVDQAEPVASVGSERVRTPEQIAAEIRRVMGLEPEESGRVEIIEEEVYEDEDFFAEPVQEPAPEPAAATRDHGGHLRERVLARSHGPGRLEDRHLTSAIETRHPGSKTLGSIARSAVSTPTSGRRRRLDLSDMARAFITMEVLGPPRAMRELDSTSS